MKNLFKSALLFCLVAFLFSSCGKKNEEGKMIPESAVFVAQVNMKSVSEKLSWNEIKETSWYQKAYSDSSTPQWRKKILDNPATSGIDFNSSLTFFINKSSGSDYYYVVEGKLKSEKDFEQFNKNFDPSQTIKKSGDISILTLKDKNVVGWNDSYFAYVMNSATTASEMYSWNDADGNQTGIAPDDNSEDLATFCAKLFSLKADSSLAKNDKFSNLLKEKGDLHFWQNTEEIMKGIPNMGMLGMLKLDVFFKDNISTFSVSFDKGKIEIDQKGYAGKELTDFMKKNKGSKINTDMIKNIPSQNVFGIFAMNFKPEAIKELIQLTGTDGMVNMYLQQLGFSLDDLSKANNGDLLVALSDFKMKTDSVTDGDDKGNTLNTTGYTKPDVNFIFSMGVKDKPSFQKIINAGKKMSAEMGKDTSLTFALNDKFFAFSNSNSLTTQYLAGNNNKFDFMDKISGQPIAFFLDLHKLLSEVATGKIRNADDKALLDQSLKIWNTVTMAGGDIKEDAFTSKTEVNLIDQNTNSLKQLNHYFDEMFKINEAKRARNVPVKNLDSLLTPPPIDTVKVQ
ncbi:MAG: DUF4836 family protein [Ginsengibacter sp.]